MNASARKSVPALCHVAASECIGFSVRKAARVIAQVYDEVLAPTGLRGTQFSLLNALALSGGATIKQLAGRLVMDRTTLTRNLKPLHKERLIEIAPGADRRQRTVTLTASGRARLREALPLWEQAQTQVLSILGARRADRLRQDLGKLVEGARP